MTREYDLVAVKDLDAKNLMDPLLNSRNRVGTAWGTFLQILEYKCTYSWLSIRSVQPKECAACGIETDKPLWVSEHSCPFMVHSVQRLEHGLQHLGTRSDPGVSDPQELRSTHPVLPPY